MLTPKTLVRVVGWLLIVVAAARGLASYYAVLTAPGHLRELLSRMSASYFDIGLLVLGLACLTYAAWSDRLLNWLVEHINPGTQAQALRNIEQAIRDGWAKVASQVETRPSLVDPRAAKSQAEARAVWSIPKVDPAVREAVSGLIARGHTLLLGSHPISFMGPPASEVWTNSHAAWEDSVVALLRRMDRVATANAFRGHTRPRFPTTTLYFSALTNGATSVQIDRLCAQLEVLQDIEQELSKS